ncbi:TPA: helix-turn-helix transcriptional regulator, partial [Klebsiella pneumoniae]|nr:helix-turn-helix transcriptional regulator [Klebsiella pneumoniae]
KKKTLTSAQIADAERLKALYEAKKKELGITQQSIADMLDISQGGVGHYLNGRNALNAAVAAVFARALQVDVSDFSPSLAKEISVMSAAATSNA